MKNDPKKPGDPTKGIPGQDKPDITLPYSAVVPPKPSDELPEVETKKDDALADKVEADFFAEPTPPMVPDVDIKDVTATPDEVFGNAGKDKEPEVETKKEEPVPEPPKKQDDSVRILGVAVQVGGTVRHVHFIEMPPVRTPPPVVDPKFRRETVGPVVDKDNSGGKDNGNGQAQAQPKPAPTPAHVVEQPAPPVRTPPPVVYTKDKPNSDWPWIIAGLCVVALLGALIFSVLNESRQATSLNEITHAITGSRDRVGDKLEEARKAITNGTDKMAWATESAGAKTADATKAAGDTTAKAIEKAGDKITSKLDELKPPPAPPARPAVKTKSVKLDFDVSNPRPSEAKAASDLEKRLRDREQKARDEFGK